MDEGGNYRDSSAVAYVFCVKERAASVPESGWVYFDLCNQQEDIRGCDCCAHHWVSTAPETTSIFLGLLQIKKKKKEDGLFLLSLGK